MSQNISLADVTRAANNFLSTYNPSFVLPIPIEEIVEQKMNIAIVVVPGLKSLLGIDAFISSRFDQITIDEHCFTRFPERSRFSIAHEIGHFVLHQDWYRKYGPKNLEDHISYHDNIDPEIYKYYEIQANTFAGLVLVPRNILIKEIENRVRNISLPNTPETLAPIAQDLLDIFCVSGDVMLRRMQNENIVKSKR